MNGIIIIDENQLKIQVQHQLYGCLIVDPDPASAKLLTESTIGHEVHGEIMAGFKETDNGIKFNAWHFYIESFDGD